MMKKYLFLAVVFPGALAYGMLGKLAEETSFKDGTLSVTADRMAVDNVTKAMVATGNVTAVMKPIIMRSESARREIDGLIRLAEGSQVTTCTNCPGHLHWSAEGEVEFKNHDYIIMRNVWLNFMEYPIAWLPYFWYPLETDYGLRVMPGYSSRWGAYLLTKYVYPIAGDRSHAEGTYWLSGNTRFDLRKENGIALGQTLRWGLGEYGTGRFKVYHAWDDDYDRRDRRKHRHGGNYYNYGTNVDRERYAISLEHRWEPTERDVVRLSGLLVDDSYMYEDFMRDRLFSLRHRWTGIGNNELAWEHNENSYAYGTSVAGPLNDVYGGTMRLPEFYFDIMPQNVWILPVNYESQNRVGYLRRGAAHYSGADSVYSYNPGRWANYGTFRFDTYHRLTAPFKLWEVVSAAPRVGWRGTYYGESGNLVLDGMRKAGGTDDDAFRSVIEGGVTFAGRGTAWINREWQHMIEPYFDVLLQEADWSGLDDNAMPYVFDALDMSTLWEDQFAGRGRNLPYTYYGVTPGLRNAWRTVDEKGRLTTILDFDAYVAMQFNDTEWYKGSAKARRITKPGEPNYGEDDVAAAPGVRVRWTPAKDIMLGALAEYNCEDDEIALASLIWRHKLNKDFGYNLGFSHRQHRWWDYSIFPYDAKYMEDDEFNNPYFSTATFGFDHEITDAFKWDAGISWDCTENELDEISFGFEYRTDCLAFRVYCEYENGYTRIDGSKYDNDWSYGFAVYLRAFGFGTNEMYED